MKYLSSDGLKMVLSKLKEKFYTKTEVDEKLKSVSGGGTEIWENYVYVSKYSRNRETLEKSARYEGLYCKFIKENNKVEVYTNGKDITDYSNEKVKLIPDKFLPSQMVRLKLPSMYNKDSYAKYRFGGSFYNDRSNCNALATCKSNPYLLFKETGDYLDNLRESEKVLVRILNEEVPFSTSDEWACLGNYRLDL